jgi:RES domain-containing protein
VRLEAWRIVKAKHVAGAFTGKGAADHGGRWNSRGVAVVYTSGSQALAALETLVHLNPPVIFSYVAIRVEFDDSLVEEFPRRKLPADWNVSPPPPSTQSIGDVWARELRSAVLAVPSVIVSGELNFLLNPAHPDFRKVRIAKPLGFAFDPRLIA